MDAWYPVYGHPWFEPGHRLTRPPPWYLEHPDGLVAAGPGHPADPVDRPCFLVRDGLIYPIGVDEPWFRRIGSLIYTAEDHPEWTSAPWYQAAALWTWPGSTPSRA